MSSDAPPGRPIGTSAGRRRHGVSSNRCGKSVSIRALDTPDPSSRRTAGERRSLGFTLIEIMVALAVFALAALALVRLEGATLRGSGLVDSITLAQIVARNVAVEAMTDAVPPAAGRAEGIADNGGRRWRWTRVVRALGGGQALRIDVAVADITGQQLGRLTMVRPPPRPAAAVTA